MDTHPHSDVAPYSDTDADTHPHSDVDTHADTDADSHTDTHADTDANSHTDTHTDTYANDSGVPGGQRFRILRRSVFQSSTQLPVHRSRSAA
ncbi:MAG: hypothetical protein H8D78_07255 [Chloroflexi bacterium]|nr:hypothetical protein [Chloroflexota bacterium]